MHHSPLCVVPDSANCGVSLYVRTSVKRKLRSQGGALTRGRFRSGVARLDDGRAGQRARGQACDRHRGSPWAQNAQQRTPWEMTLSRQANRVWPHRAHQVPTVST